MSCLRVIARLDIKGPNLVKGVHLEGLRVLGKPETFAEQYYKDGIDELIYMDIVASLYGRNSLLEIIEKTSSQIFIPLTVGGGIRTVEDIQKVLCAGADKVALNTAAIRRPELIGEASRKFGSSTIVVAIEAMKKADGSYEAYTDNGREATGIDVFEWAIRAEKLGAGEIFLTSIDQEGTGLGYDLDLTRRVAESVGIPVIAHGGAGRLEHLSQVVSAGKADAVCLSSTLHYYCLEKYGIAGDFSSEGNLHFVKDNRSYTKVEGASVEKIKNYLNGLGITCRAFEKEERYATL